MAVDFGLQVYSPNYDLFARPIVVTPSASQPNAANYPARGIYGSQTIDVPLEDGNIFSDQITIIDILQNEFPIIPEQGDTIFVPAVQSLPALGAYEVTNTWHNGGGETTLQIRKLVAAMPPIVVVPVPPIAANVSKAPLKGVLALSATAPAVVNSSPSVATDNFNRADGGLGANWTSLALQSYTGSPQINSNQVGASVGSNHQISLWSANTFSPDHWCEVSIPVLGSYCGPVVRADPLWGSAYMCMIYPSGGGTNWWIFYWVGGNVQSLTGPFQLSATPIVPTDVVRFEVAGLPSAAVLTVKLNGVVVGTYTDTSGNVNNSGSPGIQVYDPVARLDNFRGGPVTGVPPVYPHGLYTTDYAAILPPAGTLKIERTQPWSCLSNITIVNRDVTNGSVLFTNVKDSPYTGWEIWIAPSGIVRVKIMNAFYGTPPNYIEVDGSTLVADGNTHMVAASYDGSSTAAGVKIYVDGHADSMTINSDTLTASIAGAADMWILNQYPGGTWGLNGVISFFMFSNIVRNAAYMTAHSTLATKPVVDVNTILYYDFAEGSGKTLIDHSASGYNGTISGAGYMWT